MLTNPDALASIKKEWSGLIDQGVFDLGAVREYDAVAKEAEAKGRYTWLEPPTSKLPMSQVPPPLPAGESKISAAALERNRKLTCRSRQHRCN